MKTVLELRSEIAALLVDELGEYTYVDDLGIEVGTAPALVVQTAAGNDPDSNVTVTGLEVVIRPNLDIVTTPLIGTTLIANQWELQLKQWDLEKDTIVASRLLVAGLGEVTSVGPRVPRSTTLDTIETRTLVLEYQEILNLVN